MTYGIGIRVPEPVDEVRNRLRDALREQGFGVLTEIDIQATLREKQGVDIGPYVILGACNPQLAGRALDVDRRIGMLLPCNVVVRAEGAETVVEALDPQVMVTVPEQPALQPVADEAGRRVRDALATLSATTTG